eukprot:544790-Prorocentrum_minimum.AAC.1
MRGAASSGPTIHTLCGSFAPSGQIIHTPYIPKTVPRRQTLSRRRNSYRFPTTRATSVCARPASPQRWAAAAAMLPPSSWYVTRARRVSTRRWRGRRSATTAHPTGALSSRRVRASQTACATRGTSPPKTARARCV